MEKVQIVDANTMIGLHPSHRLDMSVERLVRDMDKNGIAESLTLSTIGIYYDHVRGNSDTLDSAKANNRLVPVATVNPRDYFGSAGDMEATRAQGFRILKFYPDEQGWPIDSAAFGELLKQLSPLKSPIMLDIANPGEPSRAGRMVAGYPGPVVLCSISLDTLSEALAVMADLPNVMLETHELHVPGALELIADRVGSDRIVFGSGAPMRSVASSLSYVLSSDLPDKDKQFILGGNVRRILEAV